MGFGKVLQTDNLASLYENVGESTEILFAQAAPYNLISGYMLKYGIFKWFELFTGDVLVGLDTERYESNQVLSFH